MNAFVRKEIRLLLPNFVISLVLAFTSLISSNTWMLCPFFLVLLALNSFGNEVGAGTFSNLLSQPISRRQIWRTKTSLLAASIAFIWLVWIGCLSFGSHWDESQFVLLLNNAVFAFAVFSGGLWTVLLLRQVAAAFWFTLLIPAALYITIKSLLQEHEQAAQTTIWVVLSAYGVVGFVFARRLFFRAQDTQWTGGTIVLPEVRGFSRWKFISGVRRIWRPRMALLMKEFQLHQSQLIIAGALVLLHLGVILLRNLKTDLPQHRDLEFILKEFWGLWLVMPMLVGCAAVAEERRLGTLEGQLCLSVRRRTQFFLKLSVVVFLSVLLGVVMPFLLEGKRIFPQAGFNVIEHSFLFPTSITWQTVGYLVVDLLNVIGRWMPFIYLAGICISIAALSFYASTLTRNTLQSLAPAVLILLIAGMLFINAHRPEAFIGYPIWRGVLIYWIGLPLIPLVLIGLAFWNYKRVSVGWNVWRRNVLVLSVSLAFVITATTAIYHRAWEKLTPLEPPHGTPRLTPSSLATFQAYRYALGIRFSDGRMWMDRIWWYFPNWLAGLTGNLRLVETADGGKFLEGTNWASIDVFRLETVGIQTDGSLWISAPIPKNESRWESRTRIPTAFEQSGNDTDWKNLEAAAQGVWLVKKDGTLWLWGTNNLNESRSKWPGLRAFAPVRMGTESNWAEVFSFADRSLFRKTDGSVWFFNSYAQNLNEETRKLEFNHFIERDPGLQMGDMRAFAEIQAGSGARYHLGIRPDGTFRIWANQQVAWDKDHRYGSYEWLPVDLQIGAETNWLDVVARDGKIITLKRDGSMWLWNFHFRSGFGRNTQLDEQEMMHTKPVRLSAHSDWVAISSFMGSLVSLAGDGSVWFWRFEPRNYYYRSADSGHPPLLEASRKPQKIASIFEKR